MRCRTRQSAAPRHLFGRPTQRKDDEMAAYIGRELNDGVSSSSLGMGANGAQLRELAALYDAGPPPPLTDKASPFDQPLDARAYVERGRANGKVVIPLD